MKIVLLVAASAALACTTGCVTNASYTNPTDSKTAVVSLDKVNMQDWDTASGELIQSLLGSNVLAQCPHVPAVFFVDRIVNKTSDANLDTDILSKNIQIALNKTGKVQTTTTYGRQAESAAAKDIQTKNDFLNGTTDHAPDHAPDYTLTGKIIEDNARAGNTRQVTYIFQLSLTDTATGQAVWEDQKMIQKTGHRPQVGW